METEDRAQLERDVTEAYEASDELGQALFHLAVTAAERRDTALMRDLFVIDGMERRGGQGADLNSCEAFGALPARVKGEELGQWARAVGACCAQGSAEILHGLDALARRRVSH